MQRAGKKWYYENLPCAPHVATVVTVVRGPVGLADVVVALLLPPLALLDGIIFRCRPVCGEPTM